MCLFYLLDQTTRQWVETASWAAAIVGVGFAVFKGLQEVRESRAQRERELRWKQAAAARELLNELFDWEQAWFALQMLERDGRVFAMPEGGHLRVTAADYRRALSKRDDSIDDKDQYLRDCFDSLFYYFGLFEHYIMRGLVQYEDLASPIHYYLRRLTMHLDVVVPYLKDYDFDRTERFLKRFSPKSASPEAARTASAQSSGSS
jgi:hypothetical protein